MAHNSSDTGEDLSRSTSGGGTGLGITTSAGSSASTPDTPASDSLIDTGPPLLSSGLTLQQELANLEGNNYVPPTLMPSARSQPSPASNSSVETPGSDEAVISIDVRYGAPLPEAVQREWQALIEVRFAILVQDMITYDAEDNAELGSSIHALPFEVHFDLEIHNISLANAEGVCEMLRHFLQEERGGLGDPALWSTRAVVAERRRPVTVFIARDADSDPEI